MRARMRRQLRQSKRMMMKTRMIMRKTKRKRIMVMR